MKRRESLSGLIDFLDYLRKDKTFLIGFSMFTFFLLLGFVVSNFSPYDPRRWNVAPRELPPCWKYPFGTTTLGQDLFWLITWGLRNSMMIGIIGSLGGLAIGVPLGFIAGYKGGYLDRILILMTDVLLVLPTLILLILIGSIIRAQLNVCALGLLISLFTWSGPVRNIRSMVLSLREREFTYTDVFSGFSTLKTIFKHYLPFVFPWMSMASINRMFMAMGMEVTLAVFGLFTVDEATLGTILQWAMMYQALLRGVYWWLFTPIIILVMLFTSLYLTAVGLNRFLDPRTRIQRKLGGKMR